MDTTTLLFISWLMLLHFIGDFVLQTDEMAINKSSSNWWLTVHVLVYVAILAAGCFTVGGRNLTMLQLILTNGAFHWITDWATSRATTYLWRKGDRHNFFVIIGLDQLIHFATFIVSAYFIL